MWDANRTTLEKVKDPTFADKLKYTEEKLGGVFQYKFGVIYRKSGQAIDKILAKLGGDVERFVPAAVHKRLLAKFA